MDYKYGYYLTETKKIRHIYSQVQNLLWETNVVSVKDLAKVV